MSGAMSSLAESEEPRVPLTGSLLGRVARYMDRHLLLHLLSFIHESGLHDRAAITKYKIKVMMSTNMIDAVIDELEHLPEDDALRQELEARDADDVDEQRQDVLDRLEYEEEVVAEMTTFFEDSSAVAELRNDHKLTVANLEAEYNITAAMVDKFYELARYKYDCGLYNECEQMLQHFLQLKQTPPERVLSAYWGRLACRLLEKMWDGAMEDVRAIRELVDTRGMAPAEQLAQRSWLLHWALFIFFNKQGGTDDLLDFFLDQSNMQTVENCCPWLLRYFIAAVVLSRRRRAAMRGVVMGEIRQVSYMYTDAFCRFMTLLFDDFDFHAAQDMLLECERVARADFFLHAHADAFMDESKKLIFETFCQVHCEVDLGDLAQRLNMTQAEAEKSMVDLVVSSTLDARIDSSANRAVIKPPMRASQQRLMDRARDLTHRSTILAQNLQRVTSEQAEYIKLFVAL
mmetsp:Transcript_13314/g.44968  ORF Transcript_13314/g.44968 Transcript_13314/m.44968 type:complete len:459 (+) Transcript_13314:133-1509(+)